jgi:hypothetical protein
MSSWLLDAAAAGAGAAGGAEAGPAAQRLLEAQPAWKLLAMPQAGPPPSRPVA